MYDEGVIVFSYVGNFVIKKIITKRVYRLIFICFRNARHIQLSKMISWAKLRFTEQFLRGDV